MKHLRPVLLFLILSFFFGTPSSAQEPVYVGITAQKFNYIASSQRNTEWCWAASLQMIFNYYGVDISQEQIVNRSYGTDDAGRLPNTTGDLKVITENLNNWSIDNQGKAYHVSASLHYGAPTPSALVAELARERPVLIGYKTGPNTGHAVLITACSYIPTKNGPEIRSVIVRDPWPSAQNRDSAGRIEYWGHSIAPLIQTHWYVRLESAPEALLK